MKRYINGELKLNTLDPDTEKKGAVTIRHLVGGAPIEQVKTISQAVENLLQADVVAVQVIETYAII